MRREFLLIASQSQRIVKQDMKILVDQPSTPEAPPKATLGLVILSSTSLAMKRDALASGFRMQPYCEVVYNFHSKRDQILVLEQLYVSR